MKASKKASRSRGFTIMELTLAMVLSMLVASGILMLLGVHTSFMQRMQEFRFLRDEAPQVNSLIAQMVGKSVAYQIHVTRGDAFGAIGAVNTGGRAVRLTFRNPNGLVDQSVIAFEVAAGRGSLNLYRFRNGAWSTTPDWTITSGILNAEFSDDTGVLLIRLVGPDNEEVTYSGTTQ